MLEKSTITDILVARLNDLQAEDPQACAALVTHKVQVAESLSSKFVCQPARGGKFNLSVLGLLNSLLADTDAFKIAAIVDDDGTVIGFTKRPQVVTKAEPVSPAPAAT